MASFRAEDRAVPVAVMGFVGGSAGGCAGILKYCPLGGFVVQQ